ncbi:MULTISPECIES: AMP-dependent synthetase/ligase [Nocardiopsis]|uniref:Acyl-CoA synthetase n=1 Tax=Nocardiopsis dassonvillei (strain ATCC 23218 / DSM 43111 / CIP 107115 / JCM 7437 / KCTC 9190 / NBRC 14626 / NCTC 10488 / NRRL B-5397 / IMRU 509) TaxID=446468 RepID=D7B1U9_NOCDD|nr:MULTISPECIES: AMP-dependent synthetase/ligase [Nocardiopsis]ADH66570.1 AMP-dependent synthetase and ligase [Nocardiopsis dassonvillei subsp. dassonvillei DSM 43111]NKY80964.1 long-chain fatty acid--CoA ligase [Nocardiopsis dassonvillei]VEI92592.1 Long-chain-fatty-acid--CoA ligase FadD15 [Nocardiopsis dassonvillei]
MPPTGRTLPSLLARNAADRPDAPALSWRAPDGGDWTTLTWSRVRDRVAALAEGYAALGVGPGDHVLLMMGNRPEHWLSDLALVHAGAVPTTVYDTAASEQVAHVARHSRARLAVVGDTATATAWEGLLADPEVPLAALVVVDGADPDRGHTDYALLESTPAGTAFERWRDLTPDDLLTVVYTSGTTGDPKGVAITHRDMLANATALDAAVALPEHPDHVCYLPLAHIAERMLGLYLPVFRASHVWMCESLRDLPGVLRHVRPPQFFGVPRVWEKFASALRAGLARMPEETRAAVDAATAVAAEHVAHRERGEEVPAELGERFERARAEVLLPLLAQVGLDRVGWASSASAPMPLDVVRFWAGFGIVVMDAWGLTESVGVATVNSPATGFRLGSVGRPLASVRVRVAEDGEVWLRGESVFGGYLQPDGSVRPATDAEGWFATGDVGRLDGDGYLWITDRKKELIVTSQGKNVAPAPVENALKEHPIVGQAYVHGDRRPYLVALLVPDRETLPVWAAARGIDTGGDWEALVAHPEVAAEAERAVAAANARFSRAEGVRRHRLLPGEWGPDTGELTPSLKLRRRVVRERYADALAELYRD